MQNEDQLYLWLKKSCFGCSLKEKEEKKQNRKATVENKAILLSMHSTWLDKLSSSKFPQKEETLKLFPTDTKYYTLYFK